MRLLCTGSDGDAATLGAPFEPGAHRMSDRRRPGRTAGWYLRGVVGLFGELLVTLGVVLGLFVGWQLFWTDVVADQQQAGVVAHLEAGFSLSNPQPEGESPREPGSAFAVVRIPRFGADYARPVYRGTDRLTLQRGIGHYPGTAEPGEVGNFAIAGHRTTYGKPFSRIAELRTGDRVIVETAESYFVYRVYADEVVLPTQVEVVLPVPGQPGKTPTEALLTMTSCHPQFSSRERWITHARLDQVLSRADGLPAELLEVAN